MNIACSVSPPGTGKTFFLTNQIMNAGAKHGYDRVFVASFTRTAAKEISSRAIAKLPDRDCPEPNFGTLHAHGYHALGTQHQLAENHIKQWCEDVPAYALTGGRNADVDEVQDYTPATTAADELYADMMMQRELLTPPERWRIATRAFASRWGSWKQANGYIDFTDMLEIPLRDVSAAPGAPRVGILDEAQDASPLQMALFRKWGQEMEFIVLAGDDDQCIFEWCGARPEVMLDGEFAGKRVLSQSYRVPRAVHQLANETIRAVRRREDKEYKPRDAEGEVRRLSGANLQTPELIIKDMRRYLDDGKTVMLLATCSYMLDPLVKALRAEGIAFHNPYRTKSGAWNPLRAAGENGISSIDRLLNYREQVPCISTERLDAKKLISWYEIIKTTGNVPRGKHRELIAVLEEIDSGEISKLFGWEPGIPSIELYDYFDPACKMLEYIGRPDLERDAVRWLVENAIAAKSKALEYPAKVLEKSGADALKGEPKVIIGTVHSVKGGEADCSPGDELVLTVNRGYAQMQSLDPSIDRIASFNSDHHKIHRGGPRRTNGYEFQIASREYSGDLLTIKTESSKTRVTPNHILTVRWNQRALKTTAVYLMRRGSWWRIGTAKMQTGESKSTSGITTRLLHERADEAWIIGLFDTQHEALYFEQLWGHVYNIPDLTFEQAPKNCNQLSSGEMHQIWNSIDSRTGAMDLMLDFGLSESYPMWSSQPKTGIRRRQTGTRNRWPCRACNLLVGFMEIPTDPGHGINPIWREFSIDYEKYEGKVYSINVEPWHHYISGGAVVHNCVYVAPDVSYAGFVNASTSREAQDAAVRLKYVAYTRAKESLILLDPYSRFIF